jgi:hypothetical protein
MEFASNGLERIVTRGSCGAPSLFFRGIRIDFLNNSLFSIGLSDKLWIAVNRCEHQFGWGGRVRTSAWWNQNQPGPSTKSMRILNNPWNLPLDVSIG